MPRQARLWGGKGNFDRNDGAIYDASNDTWKTMSDVNAPPARTDPRAVFTGDSLIV